MLKANNLTECEKWDFESFVLSRMSLWNITKDIGISKSTVKNFTVLKVEYGLNKKL